MIDYYITMYPGHDASVAIFDKDYNLIVHIEEERLSRQKHDTNVLLSLQESLKYLTEGKNIVLYISEIEHKQHLIPHLYLIDNDYIELFYIKHGFNIVDFAHKYDDHHFCHAIMSHVRSGFDESLTFVFDGSGSRLFEGDVYAAEVMSIYHFNNDEVNEIKKTHKWFDKNLFEGKFKDLTDIHSFGKIYKTVSRCLFNEYNVPGKTMGLAGYGTPNMNLNPYDMCAHEPQVYEIAKRLQNNSDDFVEKNKDAAATFQYYLEVGIEDIVREYTEKCPNVKNITMSGGVILNIMSNKNLIEKFPHINFYFEPVCYDGGIPIGAFYRYIYKTTGKILKQPLETLYCGQEYNYVGRFYGRNSINQICDVLENDGIVALYQGKAETGPRALGNRSFLMDPRKKENGDKMNSKKGRELWRPLACICMEEHAHEYFKVAENYDYKFMMVAVDATEKGKKEIPSILHVDNTCRLQTINENDNPYVYSLLKKYYERTGCPLLINTSFNLAGEPIVETPLQAMRSFEKGGFEMLVIV